MPDLILRYRTIEGAAQTSRSNDDLLITDETEGNRRRIVVTANRDMYLLDAFISLPYRLDKSDLVMANGYQTWTETREFAMNESLFDLDRRPSVIVNNFHFKNYGSQAFWPQLGKLKLGFDFSYVRGKEPLFIGSYNHRNAYLVIWFNEEGEVTLFSDVEGRLLRGGDSFTLFDYMTAADGSEYYASYKPREAKKLFGYTSWYNHYQNINEELIYSALDKADERFDLFQIDDGFETFVGDWFDVDKTKFPGGLEPVVKKIHGRGMMAGIWLSPFVAENKSRLLKEHPDWIAKDEKGNFIYAGCNWSGDAVVDLNRPEAVEYIRSVLRHYVSLGFDFFKLDFLYAVNLKRLKNRTRAETSEFAYGLVREELEGKLVLGCGATLSNCFERFEYCRIGPDVSLPYDDWKFFHPERVSTKIALQNTISRSGLDGHMFLNDPDVFLLRDNNIKMSPAQRESLTKINALFGSLLMTSDDIGSYDQSKKAVLDEALKLFYEAKVLDHGREGGSIRFSYELDGKRHDMRLDVKLGTLKEE